MRFSLTVYYVAIVLVLSGIALIITAFITWNWIWSALGAGVSLTGAILSFWNIQRSGPARHRRKDEG